MVALSGIESLERLNFCDDGPRINFCSIKLRDVSLSDALLFPAGVKNRGAVLGAGIRALAVPLAGVGRDGGKNPQKLGVSGFLGIVNHAYGFGGGGEHPGPAFVG